MARCVCRPIWISCSILQSRHFAETGTTNDYTDAWFIGFTPKTLTLIHTEVPKALRGRGLGARLVESAVKAGRAEGLLLVVVCPFARAYLRAHPYIGDTI